MEKGINLNRVGWIQPAMQNIEYIKQLPPGKKFSIPIETKRSRIPQRLQALAALNKKLGGGFKMEIHRDPSETDIRNRTLVITRLPE